MVRMSLDGLGGVERLDFDLSARTVDVYHDGDAQAIFDRLNGLSLGTTLSSTVEAELPDEDEDTHGVERHPLGRAAHQPFVLRSRDRCRIGSRLDGLGG